MLYFHQANMLARRRDGRPQIVLLDHGLYKRISDDFRRGRLPSALLCCMIFTMLVDRLYRLVLAEHLPPQ